MKCSIVRAAVVFATLALANNHVGAAVRKHANVIRGGSWRFHTDDDPCDVARTSCTFASAAAPAASGETRVLSTHKHHHGQSNVLLKAPASGPVAELKVSTTQLEQMDSLSLSFTLRNGKPTAKDWIGVYCNDDEKHLVGDNEYIDWRWTGNVTAGTIILGPFVNMRCVYEMRYFATSNGTSGDVYTNLGSSPLVKFARGNTEPTQVRVGSTEHPSEMRVSWVSSSVAAPTVMFGSDPNALTKRARDWRYVQSE